MKGKKTLGITITILSIFVVAFVCYAAYNHSGDSDSVNFRTAYPDKVGTKLDSCTTCHSGGSYTTGTPPNQKTTTLGSCQWCHYITKYGAEATEENLLKTLNSYGLDYKNAGRNAAALQAISGFDSDGDGFTNLAEINALTYPGEIKDNPNSVPAPSRIISLKELEKMPQHKQFMLMNASKSDDSYTKYSGVALEKLIQPIMLDSATGITVYSPDGFATYHPFEPSANANSYHVFGVYPQGTFYYNERADIAVYPPDPPNYVSGGWCNYSSPSAAGRENESVIFNPEGLKMMLAFKRDGEYLTPGVLNLQNKLDGEGPFRVVPPQKIPGPPDQRSSSSNQNVIWPYKSDADHNAGYSTRATTMIKVEPLPEGTTDIDTMEAGWPYVDSAQIVIYGSINPVPNILEKLVQLHEAIDDAPKSAFKNPFANKLALKLKIDVVWWLVKTGHYDKALQKLDNDILQKMNGCSQASGTPDKNDWVKDCEIQKQFYWLANEIMVLMKIVA